MEETKKDMFDRPWATNNEKYEDFFVPQGLDLRRVVFHSPYELLPKLVKRFPQYTELQLKEVIDTQMEYIKINKATQPWTIWRIENFGMMGPTDRQRRTSAGIKSINKLRKLLGKPEYKIGEIL